MRTYRLLVGTMLPVILAAVCWPADRENAGIDPDALIDQIVTVDTQQRDRINDLVLDAEYVEGKRNKDGTLEENKRFTKKVYVRFLPDPTLFH